MAGLEGRDREIAPTEDPPKNRMYSFLFYFFIVEQQKSEVLVSLRSGLGACCLTILIYTLICLRVRCAHAIPTLPDFKMRVYGMKHESLW